MASGRQVRHPAHRLRQQDGPHRRRFLPRPRDDGRPPRAPIPWRCRCPSAARPSSAASSTSSRCRRSSTRTSSAPSSRWSTSPTTTRSLRTNTGSRWSRPSPTMTITCSRPTSKGRRSPPSTSGRSSVRPRSTSASRRCFAAPPSRTRACSRSWTPSSSTCRRRCDVPPVKGIRPNGDEATRLHRRRRAVRGPRLQGRRGPLRRQAHLLPRLLRHAQGRLLRAQRHQGQARAHQPHPADARQSSRGPRGDLCGRARGGCGPQGHHDRRNALRGRQARSSSSPWSSRSR